MRAICNYLEAIEQAKGTNAKKLLLAKMLSICDCARDIFELVYGDKIYGLSTRSFEKALNAKVANYEDAGEMAFDVSKGEADRTYEDLIFFLKVIDDASGNKQLLDITNFYADLEPMYAKWFTRIILKNLRIGVTRTTVNKVLNELSMGTIESFSVQLCGSIKNIEDYCHGFPCIASIKYDGMRCIIRKIKNQITFTSRQGKFITYVPELEEEFKKYDFDFAIDGEIMANDFSAIQKRIGRKSENIEPVKGLHFRVFDIISLKGEDIKYLKQSARSALIIMEFQESALLKFEESERVINGRQLCKYYHDACKAGEEGIIIKNPNSKYVSNSRDNWWKVKPVIEASLRVVGFEFGRGKFNKTVGALLCEDSLGKIKVKVGSGLTDEYRELLHMRSIAAQLIGTIVEVKYNEITSKADGTHSLRFPRFIKIRSDISDADDLSQ